MRLERGILGEGEKKHQSLGVSKKFKSSRNKNGRDVEEWKVVMKDEFARI